MIITASGGDTLLQACFRWRFSGRASENLAEFYHLLATVELPFDLVSQMRNRDFPGYPGFEDGWPDYYYYFVPDSGWGSVRPFPADSLDKDFVYSTDGSGLNFGCPLRLYRALQTIEKLGHESLPEILRLLGQPTTHLPAVEEVLWADLWKPEALVQRGAAPVVGQPWFDWSVASAKTTFRLECKFRPSDWPRISDPNHLPLPGQILARAARQFPALKDEQSLNCVGLTLMQPATPPFLAALEAELKQYQNVSAVICKSFTDEKVVCSLDQQTARTVAGSIDIRRPDTFQLTYPIMEHLKERDKRVEGNAPSERKLMAPTENLCCLRVDALKAERRFIMPPEPYRSNLVSRNQETGEPTFETIVPRLPA
jgi:hypothetical protein